MNDKKLFSTAYKFRLKLNFEQKKIFSQWAGCCRYIYNWGLASRKEAYEKEKKSVSYVDTANALTKLKKEEGTKWLSSPPAQVLQQALKDLDQGYQNFFRRVKSGQAGEAKGFPQFKVKNRSVDSFRFPQPSQFSYRVIDPLKKSFDCHGVFIKRRAKLDLPKIGEVEFIMTRQIEGRVRNCTILKECGEWYASFNCEIELTPQINNGTAIGIDRGVAHTLATSEGEFLDLPLERIKNLEERKKILQRRLRNKKKFSSNWRKKQFAIRRIETKIKRIRRDWIDKVTTNLAKNHSQIILEDLQIRNMTRSASGTIEEPGKNVAQKKGLNRSLLRQGLGILETVLKYKCERNGVPLILVPPQYTSKICSHCGEKENTERPSQSDFHCLACGLKMNADTNAALNIFTRGQRGSACGDAGIAQVGEAGTVLEKTLRKRKSSKESPTIAALAV
jgi:putative transposase